MGNDFMAKQNLGLTLIELVIALAVAAALTGSIGLSFRAAERRSLNDASLTLQADLRYTQRMAMIESRCWGVLFDLKNNRYHVYKTNPFTIEYTVPLLNGVVLMQTNQSDIMYHPRGTITGGFTVILEKGSYSQELTAVLSGGRVDVKEIKPLAG